MAEAVDGRVSPTTTIEDGSAAMAELTTAIQSTGVSPTDVAAAVDLEPLRKLLERPPAEVASWVLEQVKSLAEAEGGIQSLPIFKVATALRDSPIEQKEALLKNAIQGVVDLPHEQRAEAFRFITQLPSASLEDLDSNALSSATTTAAAQASTSLLTDNLVSLARETAIAQMAPEDLKKITQVLEQEQGQLVQPLLDVVPELNEQERKQITDTLVSKGIISEDNLATLEDTIRPGGHADQLANGLKLATWAYKHTWLVWGLPLFELIVALVLTYSPCGSPLLPWLSIDAALAGGIACSAYSIRYVLKRPYLEFSADPMSAAQRIRATMADGGTILDAVPEAKHAVFFFVALVCLVAAGAVLALLGAVELYGTILSSCSSLSRYSVATICLPIMTFRLLFPIVLAHYIMKAARKIQELQARQSLAQPLISEEAPTTDYGGVAEHAPV